MRDAAAIHESHDAPDSGGASFGPSRSHADVSELRALARKAEELDLDELAFELLLAAARIEMGRRADVVARELRQIAGEVGAHERPFYRRAARSLLPSAA